VASADEPTPSRQGTQQGSPHENHPPPGLGALQKKLVDLLRPIAKSARLMDDSAAAAHQIAEDIYSFVSEKVFTADGSLDPARYVELWRLFEMVWEEENDTYDVYEGVLERHKKRRDMDLTVGETSADLEVLVDRRRKYIRKLRAFKDQVVTVEGYQSGLVETQQQASDPG
jgi:hypothetical protein